MAVPVTTTSPAGSKTTSREEDQRIFFPDVTWTDFEVMLAIRGDRAGVRMTYLNGVLELMSPSLDHEGVKKCVARLLEIYALETGLDVNGFGSWTLKNPLRARALEPDECYSVGSGRPTRPDLAIEVIWTSGGIDKLEVYRGLGVPEVWIWRDGRIEVHQLAGDRYERHERSALFADLDLEELARHVDAENQSHAVRQYRDALRRRLSRQP
jgi:Uma2 family endonuclease